MHNIRTLAGLVVLAIKSRSLSKGPWLVLGLASISE
jgi:hypothetical protein